jgi:hypothetical protein
MDLTSQFSVGVSLIIFVIFLVLGYLSMKRSGGFFLILAGFSLMNVGITAISILGAMGAVIVLFGCFVILTGVLKAFYNKTAAPESK